VHKVSFLVKASHQQERGRSLEHPKVVARVETRRELEEKVYRSADGLVCTSDNARRLLDEHFATHAPIQVIPNGTRIPRRSDGSPVVAATLDDTQRDLDVLYVGQLYDWKGVDQLVRAMKRLPGRRLDIVGGNVARDLDRLGDLVRHEGLHDRVTLHGYVPPGQVQAFLRRAKVGVIPLPEKGYLEATLFTSPLKLFELWQHGVPVVASDVPSIRELVPAGDEALLVQPDDTGALAAGLQTLLEDRARAASLVASAATRVLEYSWECRARQILDFMHSLNLSRLGNEV
jgi:glycosyltransferase involved in cell wall biosynthesis